MISIRADTCSCYCRYHRQFKQVIRDRYLREIRHKFYIHGVLAHYFMGTFGGGKEKAFKYTDEQKKLHGLSKVEGKADRKVPQQALKIGEIGCTCSSENS
jgi:hypothetical protein